MEDKAIVYTISQMDDERCMFYTRDSRVLSKDRSVECVNSKLINTMIMISEILNGEGFAVLFEVD
jgi:hypothetical protein